MKVEVVEFGSELHARAVQLRREVLRYPLGMDYTPEQVAEDAYKIVLAATDGDEVIGTMQITDEGDGWQRFRAVAVSPMRQRQGIGRVLSAFGEDLVRAKGGHSVMLHARYMALRFYGSLGYAEVGPWFYEVGMPHKRMEKRLDR